MPSRRIRGLFCLVLISLVGMGMLIIGAPEIALAGNEVIIIELEGPINPGTAMYVVRGL